MRRFSVSLLAALVVSLPASAASLNHIGSKRQLLLDDQLIESTERTMRRLNPAVKSEENPIIRRDRPWEGNDNRIAWVIFDQALGKFRLRYSSGTMVAGGRDAKGEIEIKGGESVICEAFSEDGVHWTKPDLGLFDYKGSKANNIVPRDMHLAYFFQDLHEKDPQRRYKAHVRNGSTTDKRMTFELYYSADGYRWTAYEKNPTVHLGEHVGRWGPTNFLGWDPVRNVYAVHMENNLHMNSPYKRRSIGRAESPDMTHWTQSETIVVTDDRDYPDTDFYAMPTAFHDGWYFAFPWVFSTTNTQIAPQFAFSRDGLHYNRTYREAVIPLGDKGDFDCVTVYAQEPIVHGNEIFCFYTGTNWRSPEQSELLGDKSMAGIGLAKLPIDGFVSFEGARREYSTVTTRSFSFSGKALYVNMYAAFQQWGAEPCDVRVEILDERHTPIPGFTLAEADILNRTGTDQNASWKGRADVRDLDGRAIRLKFYFKNAKLYSFQFR